MVLFLMAASFAVGLEGLLASEVKNRCPADIGRALRTVGVFGNAVPAILNVLPNVKGMANAKAHGQATIKIETTTLTICSGAI